MKTSRLAWLLGTLFVTATGCSLINAYDDVKPLTEVVPDGGGDSGGSAGSGGTGGSAGAAGDDASDAGGTGGSAGTGGTGGSAGDDAPYDSPDAAADADAAGDADAPGQDAPADAEAGPVASGAVVVAGTLANPPDGGSPYVLSVLDPTTGKETTRESIRIGGFAHDGQPNADLWYLFEVTTSSAPGTLHVRRLDPQGKWLPDVGKIAGVPVATSTHSIAVLNGRLVYLANFAVEGGPPQPGFVVIDTSIPATPKVIPYTGGSPLHPVTGTGGALLGVVGIPNKNGVGGFADLVQAGSCAADEAGVSSCDLLARRVTVNSGAIALETGNGVRVGGYPLTGGAASFAYDFGTTSNSPATLFAFPGRGPFPQDPDAGYDNTASVQRFNNVHLPLGPAKTFSLDGPRISGVAYAECFDVALVVEQQTDEGIFALPLGTDAGVVKVGLTSPAPDVIFEPYTNTVLRPFAAAQFELTAYTLSMNGASPALKLRSSNWSPPSDYKPLAVGVKHPIPPVCQ